MKKELKSYTAKKLEEILKQENIDISEIQFRKDEIELCCGYYESNDYGSCNDNLIDELFLKISQILPTFKAGFKTGYGSLIIRQNYKSAVQDECF